jgi:hypothetical protein
MIYNLLRSMCRLVSGIDCRRCGVAIEPADAFGVSEGVCRGCRI